MRESDLDQRTREDILDHIEKTAAQYTPEWRFDRENSDAGTALTWVYADMFARMLGKLNRVLDKNKISFFNSINANVLPPVPSSGYVVFDLVNDTVDGTEIESGMGVYADAVDGEVAFRTLDDVYATPANIEEIYQVWDQRNLISHIYSAEGEKKEFILFNGGEENLQKHEMYFCHDQLLDIQSRATIEVVLFVRGEIPVSVEYIQALLNRENAVFEYYTENDFVELRPMLSEQKQILFQINDSDPAFARTEIAGIKSCFIRCRILNMAPFEKFSFESFYMTVKSNYLLPDVINGNGIECSQTEYSPFGERFGLYNEVYFACREALSKLGSVIEFTFSMDFVKIPLTEDNNESIDWDWVMKKSDVKVNPEYDLTIEEVLWEYYNGNGWSRLFEDSSYSDIFHTQNGVYNQYRNMRFICPDDMVPVFVNSCESYFIRARVTKISNLYKNKGYYIAPVLSDTTFSYDYGRNMKKPQWICTYNNLQMRTYQNGFDTEFGYLRPFQVMGARDNTIYIGFSHPLTEGPVKILFTMMENMVGTHARFKWEYYGSRGFAELNLVDETRDFSRTGIVTIMGSPDFKRTSFFGRELYWIRVVDENGYYAKSGSDISYPCVQGIYMNAVRVSNVDFSETEYFTTERYEENKQITLLHPHVIDLSVWVDEGTNVSDSQLEELKQGYETDCVYDALGILRNVWVKWQEVSDFVGTDGQSRCFLVDKNSGVITFGSGRYGKIIPASRQENIRVEYCCGGGQRTNLEPGTINRMEYSVGFVKSVTNPQKILGGCDQETVTEAADRTAQSLKNHYKAVTAEDFERLAIYASRNICRATCFTGYNGQGHKSPGAVTLVVLQREYECGRDVFNEIKNQVYQYMFDKIDGHLIVANRFYIVEPQFVEVRVRLQLTAADTSSVFQIKKEIESRLLSFLNPLSGHFDGNGWRIGTLPSVIQLQNLLRDVHGVKYIKNVFLSLYVMDNAGYSEVDLKEIMKQPFILPVGGKHEIIIKVE